MKKWLKISVALVVALVVLVVIAVSMVDVNRFTPQLQAAAKQRGFDLQIKGGVGLSFWPDLGLKVQEVSLTPLASPKRPLLQLNTLRLQVPIRPLLQGELVVKEISLKGADIDLWVDNQGRGNWAGPLDETAAPASGAASGESSPPAISLSKLVLEDVNLRYQGATGEPVVVEKLQLKLQDVNLNTVPFSAELQGRLVKGAGASPVGFSLKQKLALPQTLDAVSVTEGDGRLEVLGGITLALTYDANLTSLQKSPLVEGHFATAPINIHPYLDLLAVKTQNPNALTQVAVKANYRWQEGNLQLNQGVLNLDDTALEWQLKLPAKGAMALDAKADQLNLDDYLPPKAPAGSAPPPVAPSEGDALDGLSQLNLSADLSIKHLQLTGRKISNAQLQLAAQDGVLKIQKAQGDIYDGHVAAEGSLRVKPKSRQLALNASLQGLQLEPLITELKLGDDFRLSGVMDGTLQANGEGASLPLLQKALNADVNFSGKQMRMAPLNVTEQYCKMVNMATQLRKSDDTWEPFTQMTAFSGQLQLRGQSLKLVALQAAVNRLRLDATGEADLANGTYQAHLPITLSRGAAGQLEVKGCDIGSDFWLDRSLPLLRCRGEFAHLDPKKDCGADSRGIGDLVKDYALYKLKKGDGLNVDHIKTKADEKKDELKQKLESQIGEDNAKKIEDKLKRLFRGKEQKEPPPQP